jgi:quercetin dioxygenase-like cupin family protein
MNSLKRTTLMVAVFAALIPLPSAAQHADHHKSVSAADLKWAAVPSLPKGAQIAVIEGPMNQAVPFTVRLKFPANYRIPPHTHPAVERVTVLTGTFHMGMGEKFDRAGSHAVAAGDMMIMQPGTAHYAWTEGEVIVQLHGTGPWGVTYINAAEDPRNQ